MKHPLEAIPQGKRLCLFLTLLALFLVITIGFRFIGPAKPNIVDFELAGTTSRASEIINAWDAQDKARAGFSLGFDFLYMPVYSTLIALACVWGAGILASRQWRTTGLLLAWGLWAAALLDAVENVALTVLLFGTVADPYPQVAQVCASLKFVLILLGLVFAAVAAVAYLGKKRKASR
ncbi:MAG: hypothetical protein FJZ83_05675 [Chloroflexi bacterium]|nr:hypothetical protein [Chloroflexota bacterium]MBM4451337.1 hypothetical protein [Chloroflexota bacterium]